ncbi:MAG: hypothetical protein ACOC2W_01180 [bacterium]
MKDNSKQRLLEVFRKVNNLSESLTIEDKNIIVGEFVDYVNDFIELNRNLPEIELIYDIEKAREMKSFGGYSPSDFSIIIVAANRNLADVLRTLAHELVHHKQNIEGRLKENSGDTGSDEENEANSLAGVILRNFGRKNPVIYE